MPRTPSAEHDLEQLENAAGRAFRLYLAARSEHRPPQHIADLKAVYESALERCRRARMPRPWRASGRSAA
ncbi:MAG TPA: hypothetical protein VFR91_08755 [Dyella sp.]|nr:hypothetical protein [Dyella sp.]